MVCIILYILYIYIYIHVLSSFSDRPVIGIPVVSGGYPNTSHTISLSIYANPNNYTVTWLRNNTEIKPDERVMTSNSSFNITSLQPDDNGTYTVIVTNTKGSSNETFLIMVYGKCLSVKMCLCLFM